MVKQGVLLAGLSAVAVMFKGPIDRMLEGTVSLHQHIIGFLSMIFSDDRVGQIVQGVLALLLIPALIALGISTVYWFTRRARLPYIWPVVWGSWLVLLTTFTLKGV